MFSSEEIKLNLHQADIIYYPNFLNAAEATTYYNSLFKTIPWQQDTITVFGKTHLQPRLTALFANNKKLYSYSNLTMKPHLFPSDLNTIREKVNKKCNIEFTTCLANLYRNGKDSNGWHSDNEKELGKNPIIASISLGTERFFQLKHRTNKSLKQKLLLEHGSLLIMRGETQHHWLHQIAKTRKELEPRINLTFRIIK